MQLKAYNIAKNYITNNTTQLGIFFTGEGGTGKSKVIEAIVLFTRKEYGLHVILVDTGKLIIGKLSEFIGVCPINSDKFIRSDTPSLDLIARRSSRAPLVVVSFYTVITLLTRGGFISVVYDHPYHSHHPLVIIICSVNHLHHQPSSRGPLYPPLSLFLLPVNDETAL